MDEPKVTLEELLRAGSVHPDDARIKRDIWAELSTRTPHAAWRLPARWLIVCLAAAIPIVALVFGLATLLQYRPVASRSRPAGVAAPTPSASPGQSRPLGGPSSAPSPAVPGGPSLHSLRMLDRNTGWALDSSPINGGIAAALVRTTDGGRHWARVQDAVAVMDVRSAREVWVLRSTPGMQSASAWQDSLSHSTDGGATWVTVSTVSAGGEPSGIRFVDALHGWIFATPSAGGAEGSQDTTLLRTVDGGRSWEKNLDAANARAGIRATLPAACPGGGPISMPSFTDASNGWLAGWCDRVFFYATHDGGRSWAVQPLPAFPGPRWQGDTTGLMYDTWSADVSTARVLRVVVNRGFTTGANALQESALYTSADGGASWRAVRLPEATTDVSFADSAHGWIITAGPHGNAELISLYATVDGGQSWRRVLGPADLIANQALVYLHADGFQFVDASTGFLLPNIQADLERPQMYRSADGGRSWSGFPTSVP